jgi:hypothetical protein
MPERERLLVSLSTQSLPRLCKSRRPSEIYAINTKVGRTRPKYQEYQSLHSYCTVIVILVVFTIEPADPDIEIV